MAFKMGGMSFGEGTNYKSPQLMKKESAMKMAKEAAMKMKTKQVTRGPEGKTVTKTKVRNDGTIIKKAKGPEGRSKKVIKNPKAADKKDGTNFSKSIGESKKEVKSPLKAEKMYGGDKTYAEAEKKSKGNMNTTIKDQKAYEAKKKEENPDWNKREDNAWKARQNQINEYAGSKKRYDVKTGKQEDGSKVKQVESKNLKGEDVTKTVIKDEDGKSKTKEARNEEGDITSQKTVKKDVAGTEKFKKKYDDKGNLIRVRGYATGENKDAAKAEKKRLKEEARANRRANRKGSPTTMKDKSAMKMKPKVKYNKQGGVRKKKFTDVDGNKVKVKYKKGSTKVKVGGEKTVLDPRTNPDKMQLYSKHLDSKI